MTQIDQVRQSTMVADGMRIEWQAPIAMDDGVVLRADIFLPEREGRYPVVLSYGPYAKGLAFQEGYPMQWEKMVNDYPDVAKGSTNKYQSWEVVDPEKWTPDGYAVVRVDSRGTGWSPGMIDVWSPREAKDLYECVEWAASQLWSTGRVGVCGISYYAINQWQAAGLTPPHLQAMVPWEGAADFYRDLCYHGGIRSDFGANWYSRQVSTVQFGLGERAAKNPNTGESVAGPISLTDEQLAQNRRDFGADIRAHPFDDDWHKARSARWSKVNVPFLSSANWGGQGLHPRGNFEAFMNAATDDKWLEVHGDSHWSLFYTDYGVDLQKRFFAHFLMETANGWDHQARVHLNVRHADGAFVPRDEHEWPLAKTEWTRYHLDSNDLTLNTRPAVPGGSVVYDALGDGVTFFTAPLEEDTEVTGPIAAKLFVSSTTDDADLFLIVRVFRPNGQEVVFQGALDPNTPIAQGWLRVSHRRLDEHRSLPYRPYHLHDQRELLTPGEVYEVDVEVWPSCIVIPSGYRLALSIRGRDYEYSGELDQFAQSFYYASRGCGPFTHTDPEDRPPATFGGKVTIFTGASSASYLLLPIIPLGA